MPYLGVGNLASAGIGAWMKVFAFLHGEVTGFEYGCNFIMVGGCGAQQWS
ncbi:hypothetical protein [Acidithiobacillus ferriphilus]|nr:hypothetical protein [Acidithiobacillus ferriphilus]